MLCSVAQLEQYLKGEGWSVITLFTYQKLLPQGYVEITLTSDGSINYTHCDRGGSRVGEGFVRLEYTTKNEVTAIKFFPPLNGG